MSGKPCSLFWLPTINFSLPQSWQHGHFSPISHSQKRTKNLLSVQPRSKPKMELFCMSRSNFLHIRRNRGCRSLQQRLCQLSEGWGEQWQKQERRGRHRLLVAGRSSRGMSRVPCLPGRSKTNRCS